MKKLKIYLDTSVWNFVYANAAPEKQEITISFFARIHDFHIFISNVVIEEIMQASLEKRTKLEQLLKKYKPGILEIEDEARHMAEVYIAKGIIPVKKYADALHIAVSTYYEIDALLSWNYRHLANIQKKKKIMIANLEEGYEKSLELITPMEVMNDDQE